MFDINEREKVRLKEELMSSNRLFDEKIKINEELISKFNAINKENQAIIKENNLLKIDIFNLKKEGIN